MNLYDNAMMQWCDDAMIHWYNDVMMQWSNDVWMLWCDDDDANLREFIADACSAGSDTLQSNLLQGLIIHLTKSCGVSDPPEQSSAGYHSPGKNFNYEYFREFETELKNILGCEFATVYGVDSWKN